MGIKTKLLKTHPKRGDLVIVTCNDASNIEMDEIRNALKDTGLFTKSKGIGLVVANFPVEIKKKNILDANILQFTCTGYFNHDEIVHLEDTIRSEVEEAQKKISARKVPKLNTRYHLMKGKNESAN